MRHDLRAALDEVGPETTRVSVTTHMSSHQGFSTCRKCGSFPAPGSKLRYCGRCKTPGYCGEACARADWDTH